MLNEESALSPSNFMQSPTSISVCMW